MSYLLVRVNATWYPLGMKKTSKTVVITGGGSGIGEAIATSFAKENFRTIIIGRNKSKLETVAGKINNCEIIICDLGSIKDVEKLKNKLKTEKIDILVNNAGIIKRESFIDSSEESWMEQFNINLFGAVRITKALWPALKKSHGSIVNISSTLGRRPIAMTTAYSASKAAMVNWTQSLALEGAPEKIRVNCICPGLVDTPIHSYWGKKDAASLKNRQGMDKAQPLGRMGQPQDIADAVLYMSRAEWMTGSILSLDGGISL